MHYAINHHDISCLKSGQEETFCCETIANLHNQSQTRKISQSPHIDYEILSKRNRLT